MLAITLFGLQGTTYIYQGEEIGMTNAYFTDIKEYDDRETINAYNQRLKECMDTNEALLILQQKSRDNARTPMQWNHDIHKGFSTHTPWLKENRDDICAEDEMKNPNSIFYTYKRLIQYRKQYDVFTDGIYELLDSEHSTIYAYARVLSNQQLLVISNFSSTYAHFQIPSFYMKKAYTMLETNYKRSVVENRIELKPYESMMILYSL